MSHAIWEIRKVETHNFQVIFSRLFLQIDGVTEVLAWIRNQRRTFEENAAIVIGLQPQSFQVGQVHVSSSQLAMNFGNINASF